MSVRGPVVGAHGASCPYCLAWVPPCCADLKPFTSVLRPGERAAQPAPSSEPVEHTSRDSSLGLGFKADGLSPTALGVRLGLRLGPLACPT